MPFLDFAYGSESHESRVPKLPGEGLGEAGGGASGGSHVSLTGLELVLAVASR